MNKILKFIKNAFSLKRRLHYASIIKNIVIDFSTIRKIESDQKYLFGYLISSFINNKILHFSDNGSISYNEFINNNFDIIKINNYDYDKHTFVKCLEELKLIKIIPEGESVFDDNCYVKVLKNIEYETYLYLKDCYNYYKNNINS